MAGRVGDRVGYLVKRAQHALRGAMDEALRAHGLTTPQYAALSALAKEPGLSNAQLARRCFVTPQTMNVIVSNLAGAGLILRTPHPEHGRVLQTGITPAGSRILAECHRVIERIEARMVAQLEGEERDQLAELLERCVAALEVWKPKAGYVPVAARTQVGVSGSAADAP